MFSRNTLRNYRKKNEKDQGSILRFIRHSKPSMSPVSKDSGDSCTSSTDVCSSHSSNEQEIPICSKVCYITPSKEEDEAEENGFVNPKEEGINIDNVLRSPNSSEGDSSQSPHDSPVMRNAYPKRPRIESSDEDEDEDNVAPPRKRFSANGIIDDDDDLTEKLLETYSGLYPSLDKMEIYDVMQKWNGKLAEMTKDLDNIQKAKKSMSQLAQRQQKLEESQEMKRKRLEEKRKHQLQMKAQKQKRKVWSLKGRMNHDMFEVEEEGEDYFNKAKVYNSDSSEGEGEEEEEEESQTVISIRTTVLKFFNEATIHELAAVPGCSKKKAEIIIDCRPFEDWQDIVLKFKGARFITGEMLNSAKDVLYMQDAVKRLMRSCEAISSDMQLTISEIIEGESTERINKQPSILNPQMTLKPYQLIGLNWLDLMHKHDLNGVLADEMGLGKTIQAIAFLAHLKEKGELDRVSLIVVPSSTIDNWARELQTWCPSLGFLLYYGSQDERRGMRAEIMKNNFDDSIDLILTTYSMVTSSAEDRAIFRKISFHTVIFDEAHMLKNMASQRYENLMRLRALRRVLLTGTPLQNNLVELMSILIFVMPQLFQGRREELKKVFSMFPKTEDPENRGQYEKERINEAKRIMKPFFLRRLKEDVLKELPSKTEQIEYVQMSARQKALYQDTVKVLSRKATEIEVQLNEEKLQELDELAELEQLGGKKNIKNAPVENSVNMVMTLRKLANHPLLIRTLYTDEKIKEIAKILRKTTHRESITDYIIEDLSWMSDFEIHKTCKMYDTISSMQLQDNDILLSGKFEKFDELLPVMKANGDKVLIFSQFVIVLDIIEEYMKIHGYKHCRLDGSTQVSERQELIDSYNDDDEAFIFLLSTRAGGLGINLSSANKVIIHDIDFNPYNDKQAEDRCHRVGQTRDVVVCRFISEGTIEEGIYQCALQKLQLEKEVTERGISKDGAVKGDVLSLLKTALGLSK